MTFREWLVLEEKTLSGAIKIHLPAVKQTTDYSCGAACLRSLAEYFGVGPEDEKDFIMIAQTSKEGGTSPDNLVKAAKKLGLKVKEHKDMSLKLLRQYLDQEVPVICDIQAWGNNYKKRESGHYVICIGYDWYKLFFEDPSIKESRGFLTFEDFQRRWHDKDSSGNHTDRLGIAVWKDSPMRKMSLTTKATKIE